MSLGDEIPQKYCNECKTEFDNSFELVDHLLEDDEEFDPYILLPGEYKLMIGSLLKFFYSNADNPEQIKLMTQSTYITLFAFENGFDFPEEMIEEMVIKSSMQDFDEALKELLEEGNDNDEGGE